jgi:two-component system NtrC family sensor kinase
MPHNAQISPSKDYTSLKRRIIGLTLGFSVIPLLALGFVIYYQFHTSYTAKILQNLRGLLENRRDAIDLFFDERISQIATVAYTHSLEQLKDERYLEELLRLMQSRSRSYVDLGVIDEEGNHVSYVGPYQLKGVNYKNEEWFQATMLKGVHISDVFMGYRRFPHFVIAVARRELQKSWILRATIDTDIFEAMVKAAQLGKGGDAFLVNRQNVLQTTPRFGNWKLGEVMDTEFAAFPGTRIEPYVLNGREVLLASTWLRNKDWLLVITEDPHEELAPLVRARSVVLGVVLGGVLLIVTGTVLVARAITEQLVRADREKAILDSNILQSSKMAALGKLAAGIAHEVNNPLAVIKEKAGWIRDLLQEEEIASSKNFREFEDAIKKIEYHVDRARKVTHRLLGFARRMEPLQETVDVNRVLDETVGFLENEARFRNIEIKREFSEDLPQIRSDSAQLQQVFLNILENAIDAVDKDGQILVRTSYSGNKDELLITIQDTGPGIPKEILPRIFDPFFTTKPTGEGTGLGLSVSYGIVEKLGGKITVESEEGKGAAFTIHLPAH